MNIFCDSFNDICSLSAIISNSYLLSIKVLSNSSIELLIDRKCKENQDLHMRFHQLCTITINNTNINNINIQNGMIYSIEYNDHNLLLKVYVKDIIETLLIPINNVCIYMTNIDNHRATNICC